MFNMAAIFTDKKQSLLGTPTDYPRPLLTIGTGDFVVLHGGSMNHICRKKWHKGQGIMDDEITGLTVINQIPHVASNTVT
jgi:hypothetical protein